MCICFSINYAETLYFHQKKYQLRNTLSPLFTHPPRRRRTVNKFYLKTILTSSSRERALYDLTRMPYQQKKIINIEICTYLRKNRPYKESGCYVNKHLGTGLTLYLKLLLYCLCKLYTVTGVYLLAVTLLFIG